MALIKWSTFLGEEQIYDPNGKPLAARCADGRIIMAEDSRVGRKECKKRYLFNYETQQYEKVIEEIEVVWSGHRDDGYLCRGIY